MGEEFQRGYLLDERAVTKGSRPGMNADQVLQTLGTPSTVSTVGNKSWYYISQTSRRRVAFMGESVVDQRVTAVYFDKNLKVERVALYGVQDGKVFDFISRTTPTGGQDQNFVGATLPRHRLAQPVLIGRGRTGNEESPAAPRGFSFG